MSGAKRFERSYDSEPYRVRKRPSYLSPAAGRCHLGNSHSADTAPDYGPEQDTGRGDPRIYAADRARCTVAKPQRCARATARTLSPAARRRRVSPSRAGRFSGAPVAGSCPRFQPARFPPRHNRPSSAGRASTAGGCHGNRARPAQHPAAPAAPAAEPALPYGEGFRGQEELARMSNGPAIVIDVTREDWPGGPRTLTPLDPNREPNRQTFWFGAEFAPDGNRVWFRITGEAIERMPENTPLRRGNLLVRLLLVWIEEDPDHQLEDLNRFQVYVSDDGDTRIGRRDA